MNHIVVDPTTLSVDEIEERMKNLGIVVFGKSDAEEVKTGFEEFSKLCTDPDTWEQNQKLLIKSASPRMIVKGVEKWIDRPGVFAQGLSTIYNCALSEEIRHMFLHYGVLETVLVGMKQHPEHDATQARCCGCIGLLVKDDHKLAKKLVKKLNILELLVTAMEKHPNDITVQRWACKTLKLLDGFKDLRKYFMDAGVLVVLAKSIQTFRLEEETPQTKRYLTDIQDFSWEMIMNLKQEEETLRAAEKEAKEEAAEPEPEPEPEPEAEPDSEDEKSEKKKKKKKKKKSVE